MFGSHPHASFQLKLWGARAALCTGIGRRCPAPTFVVDVDFGARQFHWQNIDSLESRFLSLQARSLGVTQAHSSEITKILLLTIILLIILHPCRLLVLPYCSAIFAIPIRSQIWEFLSISFAKIFFLGFQYMLSSCIQAVLWGSLLHVMDVYQNFSHAV